MRILYSLVLSGLVLAAKSSADILVSNLNNTRAGNAQFSSSSPVYQSFKVGSSNAIIQNISIAFGSIAAATGPEPTYVTASLFSDNASTPGSSLGTFNYYGSPLAFSYGTPIFYGNFNVTANTTYWIKISTSGLYATGTHNVRTTNDLSETGVAGWNISNSYWKFNAQGGASVMMDIGGITAVPEPSTMSLVASGIFILAALGRVRRNRNKLNKNTAS